MDRLTLNYVWKQKQIPVVLRRTGHGERLRVRLPFDDDNREWIQNGRREQSLLGAHEILVQRLRRSITNPIQ